MNKTIAKLKRLQDRLSGSHSQSVEIPFEIECDCGATVKGIRRPSWIEAECTECAETVFVLPMNVYPSTRSVPSEILGGTFRERLGIVSRELIRGNKPQEANTSQAKKVKKASSGEANRHDGDEVVAQPKWKLPKLTLPRIEFKRLIIRTFSPFRLLMFAVIVTVGLTGWYMIQQQQTEEAQKIWLETTTQISERLDAEQLAGLLPELEKAINAGTVLGKEGPEFRRFNNLLRETQATEGLALSGLVEIFQAAYNDQNRLKSGAAGQVRDACLSGWFLFDAQVTKWRSDDDQWMIDFPVTPGLHSVSIVLPEGIPNGLVSEEGNLRLLFAARLTLRTAPSSDEEGQWILAVNSEDFAVITHPAHCRVAGFDIEADEALQQIIERQRKWVEAGNTTDGTVSAKGPDLKETTEE